MIRVFILALLLAINSSGAASMLNFQLEPTKAPVPELITDVPDVPVHFAFWDMDSIKPKICIIFTVSGMQCEIIDPFTSRIGQFKNLP